MTLGPWDGAGAGHFYRLLDFTNTSGVSCTMYGYPGVSFTTAVGGSQIGAAGGRDPLSERQVVLAPGGKAHVRLDMLNVRNFSAPACGVSEAHWLKVYPPGQYSARYVRFTAEVCSNPKPVYFFTGPVRPGA